MFRAGAIPLGIGLRICMEAWGAICARIGTGALGRANLKEKQHKRHKCQSPSHVTIGGCGDYVPNTRFCKLMLPTPQWENQDVK